MDKIVGSGLSRRNLLRAAAGATLSSLAAPAYAGLFGSGTANVRRIKMICPRTSERIDTIYWIDGEYVSEALAEVNWFMRDWRQEQAIAYAPRNIDTIAAMQRLLETDEPFTLLSGYRSPATNALLRRRGRGVARNSYHVKGMAADLRLKSRSVGQISAAAQACRAGGVGRYYGSNFVHVDCGPVRTWRG